MRCGVAEALDGFECLRGLTGAVQSQGQGAAVFGQSYRVFGDDLARGFEPSHGQAVVLGLAGRPHDRQPGGLVKRRGIFGAALGDLHRGGPEPRAHGLIGPEHLENLGLEQVPWRTRTAPARRPRGRRESSAAVSVGSSATSVLQVLAV